MVWGRPKHYTLEISAFRLQVCELGLGWDSGFRVRDLEFRVEFMAFGSGFRAPGFLRMEGLRDLGFRGLGFRGLWKGYVQVIFAKLTCFVEMGSKISTQNPNKHQTLHP